MNIFVVRNGQTEWNVMKKMQGAADIELNEKGLSQASDTADMLRDLAFDIIFCSPLKRAKQTAEIINDDRGLNIIFDERLREEIMENLKEQVNHHLTITNFGHIKRI